MKKLLKKFLLFLLNKLNMPNNMVNMAFYIYENGNWIYLKSGELQRIPAIGETVEMFVDINRPKAQFLVKKVIHRVGDEAIIHIG